MDLREAVRCTPDDGDEVPWVSPTVANAGRRCIRTEATFRLPPGTLAGRLSVFVHESARDGHEGDTGGVCDALVVAQPFAARARQALQHHVDGG